MSGGLTASTTGPPTALMTKLTPVVPPGVSTKMMRSPGTAATARSSRTVSVVSALDWTVVVRPASPYTVSVPPARPEPAIVAVTDVPAMPEAGKMAVAAGAHTAAASPGIVTRPATSAAPSTLRRSDRAQAVKVTGRWPPSGRRPSSGRPSRRR